MTETSEALRAVATTARNDADDVDARASFPKAAIEQLRASALLVPEWSVSTAVDAVAHVAAACASSGLIWAMHLSLLEVLKRHTKAGGSTRRFLEQARTDQLLIAGATSETGVGGDVRRSIAHLRERDGLFHLEKTVPFASYASEADAVLVTARRSEDAAESDQVLVLAERDQLSLQPLGPWRALGMRGTASGPALLTVAVPPDHVLDTPFGEICASTVVPASHTLWAACWTGIAIEATTRARRFLRAPGSKDIDVARQLRFAEVQERLTTLRSLVRAAAIEADGVPVAAGAREMARTAAFFNDVKVASSDLAVDIVLRCFELIGAAAYLEADQSEGSLSRQLRDVLSSKVMIGSDRLRTASGLLHLAAGHERVPELPDREQPGDA